MTPAEVMKDFWSLIFLLQNFDKAISTRKSRYKDKQLK